MSGVRWADLRKRAVSALVLAPLALGCVWLGGWVGLAALVALCLGLLTEWVRMWRHRPAPVALAAGLLYVLLPAAAIVWLREDPAAGRGNLMILVLIVWASDIGAYAVGRLFGGPKLAPAISPGKTWSGAVGGLVCAGLVGLAAAGFAAGRPGVATLVGIALGLVAALGDLLESAVKRHFGVKDSGGLIPGHGGLLDRLDGLWAAAPAAAALVAVLGRGTELWR